VREYIKGLLDRLVANESVWNVFFKIVVVPVKYAIYQRKMFPHKEAILKIESIFSDRVVKNGVFKGMRYPKMKSSGSTLFPKLLGSYEAELSSTIEEIATKKYTDIVDIGCAEGFYAIGLAMRLPTSNVYAFDVNEKAVLLCKEMANLNEVGHRVTFGKFCDAQVLSSLPLGDKALIVSDCEGYEKDLFTRSLVNQLSKHDFLIEVHDVFDIEISSTLKEAFSETHHIEVITSIDDIKKAKTYSYPDP